MYDDVLFFVNKKKTDQKDEYGDPVYVLEKTEVYGEKKSVKRSEFYQAQTSGYKPEIVFEIADREDYSDQPEVEYNNKLYKVLRTYETKASTLEIICYGGVRDAGTEERNETQ